MPDQNLWLVGAGPMARAYAAVLDDLEVGYTVVGRGAASAAAFEAATGRSVRMGGIEDAVSAADVPSIAIVAVDVDQLAVTACSLLDAGVERLLLEKPGGLGWDELTAIHDRAGRSRVTIAYNRRHYASTLEARRLIEQDGGVVSFAFEVTEWPHAVEPVQVSPAVRSRWFLAQSSHVVDLAFHLGGRPVDWRCYHGGSLSWHVESARFAGAGLTDAGATFGYHGDWEGPGRWGLDVLTRNHRLIFQPLEVLRIMDLGSLDVTVVDVDYHLDQEFKPGVHAQTRSFLAGEDLISCSLDEQVENVIVYETMAGYR